MSSTGGSRIRAPAGPAPVPEEAWPFLIGRTRSEDYRFVVLPAVMTGAPLAAALRSAAGGDPGEPGSALIREIGTAHEYPVTAVYRVVNGDAEKFGIPGTGPLTDAQGRPILLTEGLVLRGPAASVMAAGIARAALERAHDLVVPAFQRFWALEDAFTWQAAQPFALPSAGSAPRLRLELAGPAGPPDDPGPRAPARAERARTENTVVAEDTAGDATARAAAALRPGPRRWRAAVIFSGAVILAALVLAVLVLLLVHAAGRW